MSLKTTYRLLSEFISGVTLIVLCHGIVLAQTTVGPNVPGTMDIAYIPITVNSPWTGAVGDAQTSNGVWVDVDGANTDAGEFSDGVLFSNFGFALPCDAVVVGIEVIIERSGSSGDCEDEVIRLTDDTQTMVGDNKAVVGAWPVGDADATYGGPADDWNAGLTKNDINNSNFGVVIQYQALAPSPTGDNAQGFIDFVRINVTYNTGGALTEIQSTVAGPVNWNTAGSWNPAQVPTSCDNVTILNGHTIDMDAATGACNNLTLQGSGKLDFPTVNKTLNAGGNLQMESTSSITGTSNTRDLNVTGNFTVAANATAAVITGIDFRVTGTSAINGVISYTNDNGIKLFTGLVTVGVAGSWTSTAITTTANLEFRGGIANGGILFSASDATFSTNNQPLSGATTISFSDDVDIPTGITVTNNATTVSFTATGCLLSGAGTWTQGGGSTLNYSGSTITITNFNASTCANLVNYNLAGAQNIKTATYCNLTLSGGNTKTCLSSTSIVTGVFNIVSGTEFNPKGFDFNVTGNSNINGTIASATTAGGTVTLGDAVGDDVDLFGGTIDGAVTGTVNIVGTISFSGSGTTNIGRVTLNVSEVLTIPTGTTFNFNANGNTGVKTFSKRVTINTGGGIWTSTNVTTTGNLIFQNGIEHNNGANFTAGGATFNTNAQAILGSGSLSFANPVTFTDGNVSLDAVGGLTFTNTPQTVTGVTVTNNTTVTMSTTNANPNPITGTGTWTQGVNSTLNYSAGVFGGTSMDINIFNASASGNTVNYNRAGVQTVRFPTAGNYFHLTLSGASGTKTLGAGGNYNVDGNISIQTGAILDDNGLDITVAGNWDNSSAAADPFTESAMVTFDGGAAQNIINTGTASGTQFANITISNTLGDVTLVSNSATATGSLTFTSGKLILGTNNFTLGVAAGSGVLVGNSSTLYVVTASTGYFQRYAASGVAVQYPVGISTTSDQNLATITPGANSTFRVLVDNSVTSPNAPAQVVNAEWSITRVEGASVAATTVKLGWTSNTTTGASFDINNARVVIGRWTGINWIETDNSAKTTASPFDVTIIGVITIYSQFAVGSGIAPLPVELLFFNASPVNNTVTLEWATASEKNSDYFSIERSSDNNYFEEAGSVPAKGFSVTQNNYFLIDKHPLSGISYYRLKQTDTDGNFNYLKTVSVEVNGKNIEIRKIFPNPPAGETYIDIFSPEETPIQISLINQSGENIKSQKFNLTKGDNLLILDVNDLGPGIYFMKTDKPEIEKEKVGRVVKAGK